MSAPVINGRRRRCQSVLSASTAKSEVGGEVRDDNCEGWGRPVNLDLDGEREEDHVGDAAMRSIGG